MQYIVKVKLVLVLCTTLWTSELDVILVHVSLVKSYQELQTVKLRAVIDVKLSWLKTCFVDKSTLSVKYDVFALLIVNHDSRQCLLLLDSYFPESNFFAK